jgi:hypothetical protein
MLPPRLPPGPPAAARRSSASMTRVGPGLVSPNQAAIALDRLSLSVRRLSLNNGAEADIA